MRIHDVIIHPFIISSSVSPWNAAAEHTPHKAQGLVAAVTALDATTRVPALASPPGAVYRWTGGHFSTGGLVCILTHHSNPRTELVRIRNALHLPAIFIVRLGPLHCAAVYMVKVVEAVTRVPRSWPEPNRRGHEYTRVNICIRCTTTAHAECSNAVVLVRACVRAFKVCTGPHDAYFSAYRADCKSRRPHAVNSPFRKVSHSPLSVELSNCPTSSADSVILSAATPGYLRHHSKRCANRGRTGGKIR